MRYECGFYAVNKKHCWINGHCVVCRVQEIKEYHWYPDTKTVERARLNAEIQNNAFEHYQKYPLHEPNNNWKVSKYE